jgi:hypothetical protein
MIDFPSSPTLNQQYSYGGRVWKYNGTGWELKLSSVALITEDVTTALGYIPLSDVTSTDGSVTVTTSGTTKNLSIANISGNAATATTLQTARTINGVSFNGSADITIATGIQNISDAVDVDSTNKVEGSILVYSTQNQKWVATTQLENQNIESGHY